MDDRERLDEIENETSWSGRVRGLLAITRRALDERDALTRERDAEQKRGDTWAGRVVDADMQGMAWKERAEAADEQVRALREALAACMESMKRWGAEEDGMPEGHGIAAWEAYQQGLAALAATPGTSARQMDGGSPTWPYVLAFARLMEAKLAANRHKGDREGWANDTPESLFDRMAEEADELEGVAFGLREVRATPTVIAAECADVANFAMMIADVSGGLRPEPKGTSARDAVVEAAKAWKRQSKWADRSPGFESRNAEDELWAAVARLEGRDEK